MQMKAATWRIADLYRSIQSQLQYQYQGSGLRGSPLACSSQSCNLKINNLMRETVDEEFVIPTNRPPVVHSRSEWNTSVFLVPKWRPKLIKRVDCQLGMPFPIHSVINFVAMHKHGFLDPLNLDLFKHLYRQFIINGWQIEETKKYKKQLPIQIVQKLTQPQRKPDLVHVLVGREEDDLQFFSDLLSNLHGLPPLPKLEIQEYKKSLTYKTLDLKLNPTQDKSLFQLQDVFIQRILNLIETQGLDAVNYYDQVTLKHIVQDRIKGVGDCKEFVKILKIKRQLRSVQVVEALAQLEFAKQQPRDLPKIRNIGRWSREKTLFSVELLQLASKVGLDDQLIEARRIYSTQQSQDNYVRLQEVANQVQIETNKQIMQALEKYNEKDYNEASNLIGLKESYQQDIENSQIASLHEVQEDYIYNNFETKRERNSSEFYEKRNEMFQLEQIKEQDKEIEQILQQNRLENERLKQEILKREKSRDDLLSLQQQLEEMRETQISNERLNVKVYQSIKPPTATCKLPSRQNQSQQSQQPGVKINYDDSSNREQTKSPYQRIRQSNSISQQSQIQREHSETKQIISFTSLNSLQEMLENPISLPGQSHTEIIATTARTQQVSQHTKPGELCKDEPLKSLIQDFQGESRRSLSEVKPARSVSERSDPFQFREDTQQTVTLIPLPDQASINLAPSLQRSQSVRRLKEKSPNHGEVSYTPRSSVTKRKEEVARSRGSMMSGRPEIDRIDEEQNEDGQPGRQRIMRQKSMRREGTKKFVVDNARRSAPKIPVPMEKIQERVVVVETEEQRQRKQIERLREELKIAQNSDGNKLKESIHNVMKQLKGVKLEGELGYYASLYQKRLKEKSYVSATTADIPVKLFQPVAEITLKQKANDKNLKFTRNFNYVPAIQKQDDNGMGFQFPVIYKESDFELPSKTVRSPGSLLVVPKFPEEPNFVFQTNLDDVRGVTPRGAKTERQVAFQEYPQGGKNPKEERGKRSLSVVSQKMRSRVDVKGSMREKRVNKKSRNFDSCQTTACFSEEFPLLSLHKPRILSLLQEGTKGRLAETLGLKMMGGIHH